MTIAWAFEPLDEETLDQLLAADDASAKENQRLLCAACGHPITSPIQRTTVAGRHQHSFTNPHGIVFRIGCFSDAPGCFQVGEATEEWTWFSGFMWRIALCRHCQTHLGWGYRSRGGDEFFGLILDRLVSSA